MCILLSSKLQEEKEEKEIGKRYTDLCLLGGLMVHVGLRREEDVDMLSGTLRLLHVGIYAFRNIATKSLFNQY